MIRISAAAIQEKDAHISTLLGLRDGRPYVELLVSIASSLDSGEDSSPP